ncbi:CAP domain-containing protein [Lichenifustis flavocetrariae]|uniref:CAP domain-containing protein n=1 Tax=Lichenifustis flavocetrariae TaxID=2949735 RepID=A0AA41YUR4_9HYPH|nr:CAP domain-containing protein [Lichenifustis flavocetrariae]MCW6507695.1 CAP domain-containing protein [Lichenifustis flavocetrariae]
MNIFSALRLSGAVLGLSILAGCSALPIAPTGSVGAVALDRGSAEAMISAYRREHGLPAVQLDATLTAVAQRQADAMAGRNVLSHEVAGSLPERLAEGGADRRAAIENVSAGYASFASALEGWKRSPHHNDNLLFAPMRRMGIAAAEAPGTRYKTFWSLVMTN